MSPTEQRVAIVTGAAGGLGLAVAQLLLDRGTRVLMADVDAARLEQAADGLPGDVRTVVADLSDTAGCARVVAEAEATWDRSTSWSTAPRSSTASTSSPSTRTSSPASSTPTSAPSSGCAGASSPGWSSASGAGSSTSPPSGSTPAATASRRRVYETTKAGIGNLTKTLARLARADGRARELGRARRRCGRG